jgi:hypothetical protein
MTFLAADDAKWTISIEGGGPDDDDWWESMSPQTLAKILKKDWTLMVDLIPDRFTHYSLYTPQVVITNEGLKVQKILRNPAQFKDDLSDEKVFAQHDSDQYFSELAEAYFAEAEAWDLSRVAAAGVGTAGKSRRL